MKSKVQQKYFLRALAQARKISKDKYIRPKGNCIEVWERGWYDTMERFKTLWMEEEELRFGHPLNGYCTGAEAIEYFEKVTPISVTPDKLSDL